MYTAKQAWFVKTYCVGLLPDRCKELKIVVLTISSDDIHYHCQCSSMIADVRLANLVGNFAVCSPSLTISHIP